MDSLRGQWRLVTDPRGNQGVIGANHGTVREQTGTGHGKLIVPQGAMVRRGLSPVWIWDGKMGWFCFDTGEARLFDIVVK